MPMLRSLPLSLSLLQSLPLRSLPLFLPCPRRQRVCHIAGLSVAVAAAISAAVSVAPPLIPSSGV